MVYLGIDWAEDHHDLCVLDEGGERLAGARVPEGVEGCGDFMSSLQRMPRAPSRSSSASRPIAACWCKVWWPPDTRCTPSIPFAVSRYRDRHTTSGAKSDS